MHTYNVPEKRLLATLRKIDGVPVLMNDAGVVHVENGCSFTHIPLSGAGVMGREAYDEVAQGRVPGEAKSGMVGVLKKENDWDMGDSFSKGCQRARKFSRAYGGGLAAMSPL